MVARPMRVLPLLALALLLPVAHAAPNVSAYREAWETEPTLWTLSQGAARDCAVGHGGCSLRIAGGASDYPQAYSVPPVPVGPFVRGSADFMVDSATGGNTLFALNFYGGWSSIYVYASEGRAFIASSASGFASTSWRPQAGVWYTAGIAQTPLGVTGTISDPQGNVVVALGPIAAPTNLGVLTSVQFFGSGMQGGAHHWDNVDVRVDA